MFSRFQEQKSAIYDLYGAQIGLSKSERSRTLRYYDMFYEIIESDEETRRQIVDGCRQPAP